MENQIVACQDCEHCYSYQFGRFGTARECMAKEVEIRDFRPYTGQTDIYHPSLKDVNKNGNCPYFVQFVPEPKVPAKGLWGKIKQAFSN